MAEYWKSTPKYWCKHCKTYVVDTKLGRAQHESTARHQGNLKRFLDNLHKSNQIETNKAEAAKREVARLNALVEGKPLPSSSTPSVAKSSSGTTTNIYAAAGRSISDAERKRQLRELESLGVALPEELRKDVALPGEWKLVKQSEGEPAEKKRKLLPGSKTKEEEENAKEKLKQELMRQQKLEEAEKKWNDLDEDEKALRSFKIQERTFPVNADEEDEELNAPLVFAKSKKSLGSTKVKGENDAEAGSGSDILEAGIPIKVEEDTEDTPNFDASLDNPGDGIMFKKRKVKNIRRK